MSDLYSLPPIERKTAPPGEILTRIVVYTASLAFSASFVWLVFKLLAHAAFVVIR